MRKRVTAIVFMMAFLWAFQADAGPIGDSPRIWPEFQYRDGLAESPFSDILDEADDEISAMDLLFGEVDSPKKSAGAIRLPPEEDLAKIPFSAFILTYGAYRHRWDIPQHRVPQKLPVLQFQERPFIYRGPAPEPTPPPAIPQEEGGKYRYPKELMASRHVHPTGLADTFGLGYTLQLEKDADRFMYPYVPKDTPAPVQRVYRYGGVAPGTGAGGVGDGPAQQQDRYGSGARRGYGPGFDAAGKPQKRDKEGRGGRGDVQTFKRASGVSKGRPYAMILLGASLAAVVSLFRMFKLSLFILVGWMVFYWKDLWRIIVELQ